MLPPAFEIQPEILEEISLKCQMIDPVGILNFSDSF